jgi:hypothetical protein
MAQRMDDQAAQIAHHLAGQLGKFALRRATDLALSAHRREDYDGEALWWMVTMQLVACGDAVELAA